MHWQTKDKIKALSTKIAKVEDVNTREALIAIVEAFGQAADENSQASDPRNFSNGGGR